MSEVRPALDAPSAPPDRGAVISLRDVWFTYPRGEGPALRGVSLDVGAGERLGILGPNGGGKSTFLKLALGLLRPQQGVIEVLGLSPAEAARRRLIGYVPQRVEAELSFPITARHAASMAANLGLGAWESAKRNRARVDRMLDLVGAMSFAQTPVGELSGGQLQRVMIARALAGEPRILLLDEPTVGIDPSGQRQFSELLQRLHQELKLTTVVVSHDLRTVAATSDRVACLAQTLHYHDSPTGLTPAVLAEVFRHDAAAIFGDLHVDAHRASECAHDHGAGHDTRAPAPGRQADGSRTSAGGTS